METIYIKNELFYDEDRREMSRIFSIIIPTGKDVSLWKRWMNSFCWTEEMRSEKEMVKHQERKQAIDTFAKFYDDYISLSPSQQQEYKLKVD